MTRDTFDTAPLLNEINDCVTRGLHTILSGFMDDHRMYRETYDGVMRLPCISGSMVRSLNEFNTIEQLKQKVVELQDEIVRLKNTKPVVAVPLTVPLTVVPLTVVPLTVPLTVVPLTAVPTAEKENITLVLEVDQFDNAEEESEEESEEEQESEEEADAIVQADAIVEEESEEEQADAIVDEESDEEADEEQAEKAVEEKKEEEDDEEELFEIEIEGVSYCTGDEDKGIIYELTADGEVGKKVGYLKGGEPFFY
jgi:hypothetical protein